MSRLDLSGIDFDALGGELLDMAVVSRTHADVDSDPELSPEQKDFLHKAIEAGLEQDPERWMQLTRELAQHPVMADPAALAVVEARFSAHQLARTEHWIGLEHGNKFCDPIEPMADEDKHVAHHRYADRVGDPHAPRMPDGMDY